MLPPLQIVLTPLQIVLPPPLLILHSPNKLLMEIILLPISAIREAMITFAVTMMDMVPLVLNMITLKTHAP